MTSQQAEIGAKPECLLGFTRGQVLDLLGDRVDAFNRWMRGQTAAICDGRRYDYEAKGYVPTDCGPHGLVIYPQDVRQFLAGGGPLD